MQKLDNETRACPTHFHGEEEFLSHISGSITERFTWMLQNRDEPSWVRLNIYSSKSRQRRETTICRAAALHPLGYESIRLCATFWDNYCCAFAALGTSVKQLIKVYARWVKSGRQKYGYLMSVIDDLTHQSGTTRSEYCVKRVIRNRGVYEIDTDLLSFSFLKLIFLRYM